MRGLMGNLGTTSQDNLIAGPRFPLAFKGVNLSAGQGKLARGTVLGIVTSSHNAASVDSSKTDGTESPDCILAEDIDTGTDAGASPISAVAYSAGYFIRGSLAFGGSDTFATHELEMRKLNMILSASVDMEGEVH